MMTQSNVNTQLCWISLLILCCAQVLQSRRWQEGDVRLIGGRRRYMGTVVILHEGRWGSICDDMWGINDATVSCRQLGYARAKEATVRSRFGSGRWQMWMSKVRCTGREERLDVCTFQGFDKRTRHRCPGRYRSAGVICSPVKLPPTTVPPPTTATTPTTTASTTEQIVSTSLMPEKSTEPPRPLNENKNENPHKKLKDTTEPVQATIVPVNVDMKRSREQKPVTRKPGRHISLSETEKPHNDDPVTTSSVPQHEAESSSTSSPTSRSTTVSNIDTSGENESQIAMAESHSSDLNVTDAAEPGNSSYNIMKNDASASNTEHFPPSLDLHRKEEKQSKDTLLADAPPIEDIEVKLEGGRYDYEGHLEVRTKDGEWGGVCGDHWSMKEAMVVCNQLQEFGYAKQPLKAEYFGGGSLKKLFYRIQCDGRESNLAKCNLTRTDDQHKCSKRTAVAGVVCSHYLPDLIPNLQALQDSVRLQDQPLYYLRCSMEENCLSSSAYVLKNTTKLWRNKIRRLLRFSTVVHNRGLADFRPVLPRGSWEWHACHMHYHSMEVFAHYDIMAPNGTRLAEGSKASFCLEDTTCDPGVFPQYNCRGLADQGLSVNCSDNYMYDIDCQWIDITDIKPGNDYTFLMEVNPELKVAELDFNNNVVSCNLYYSGYHASLANCHYESLLDYRAPRK